MTSPPAHGGQGRHASTDAVGRDSGPEKDSRPNDRGPQHDSGPLRDRDAAGRPRNARPRDELGRPLSRGVPGEPPAPDESALPPADALALAQQLIDHGRPFRAHEVLEASWKAAGGTERDLWKGLAQVTVGLTHAQRGNARGAAALLRRGARTVGGYAHGCPHGIDAAGVAGTADELADWIERDGLAAGPPDHLLVRLVSTAAR